MVVFGVTKKQKKKNLNFSSASPLWDFSGFARFLSGGKNKYWT